METGIQLYQQFRIWVEKAGPLKLAWFTTFNLSLSFFERYLLSALTGTDPKSLRNLKDYEALNERFLDREENTSTMDVRVFYDYRMLQVKEAKKTSVNTIGIDPAGLEAKFKGGVFHPKVILLVNEKNEGFLVTGSANLSLAAWSRNAECVAFRKIKDWENADRISRFFASLTDNEQPPSLLSEINASWQKNLKGKTDWEFHHSFGSGSFLDRLGLKDSPLYVWSPYFSDDVEEIIDSQLQTTRSVHIVPDRTAESVVRMTPPVLEGLMGKSKVKLLKDPHDFEGEQKNLVHAKVWCTPSHLAIGSWNFSNAGLNLIKGSSNVEAGIIQHIDSKAFQSFVDSCNLAPFEEVKATPETELEAERDSVLSEWTLALRIFADWETHQYTAGLESQATKGPYFVSLPGKKARVSLEDLLKGKESFFAESKALLKDRLFTVYDDVNEGKKVSLGVIIELNPIARPAIGFDSFHDFMRAWADGKPEKHTQLHRSQVEDELDDEKEAEDQWAFQQQGNYAQAWFTLFYSFEQIKNRLEEAKGDSKELRILGYSMPGSIKELSEHLMGLREQFLSGKSLHSPAYLWFLIHEGNGVIRKFNELKKGYKGQRITPIPTISIPFNKKNRKRGKKWLQFIEEECGYGSP